MTTITDINCLTQYSINCAVKVLITRKTSLKTSTKGNKYFLFGMKDSTGDLQSCCFEEKRWGEINVGECYVIKGSKFGLNKYNRKLEMTITKDTIIEKNEPIDCSEISTFSTMNQIINEKKNGDLVDIKGIFETNGVVKKQKLNNGTYKNKFYALITDEENLELAIYLNAWENNIPQSYKKGEHFICRGANVSVYNDTTSLNLENGSNFEVVGENEIDGSTNSQYNKDKIENCGSGEPNTKESRKENENYDS